MEESLDKSEFTPTGENVESALPVVDAGRIHKRVIHSSPLLQDDDDDEKEASPFAKLSGKKQGILLGILGISVTGFLVAYPILAERFAPPKSQPLVLTPTPGGAFNEVAVPVNQRIIDVSNPSPMQTYLIGTPILFSWDWPYDLGEGESFAIYLYREDGSQLELARVTERADRFQYRALVDTDTIPVGIYKWDVLVVKGDAPTGIHSKEREIFIENLPELETVPQEQEEIPPTPEPIILPTLSEFELP